MNRLLIAVSALLVVSCGNNNASKVPSIIEPDVDYAAPAETISEPVQVDTLAARKKAVEELKSWGARDASFDDDGYLVYAVYPADITASADDVAFQMYLLFMDTPTLKGVRVVNYIDKTEMGRYTGE